VKDVVEAVDGSRIAGQVMDQLLVGLIELLSLLVAIQIGQALVDVWVDLGLVLSSFDQLFARQNAGLEVPAVSGQKMVIKVGINGRHCFIIYENIYFF
jgi:hypothetical protein